MKIICKDDFDRDSVSDRLVAENVPDYYAKEIVEFLNFNFSGYFVAKPDDYKLYVFEP